MLAIQGLHAGYGHSQVLHGIELSIAEGQVVSLMGRNGMGKTTTIRCLMGLLRGTGTITFRGRDTTRLPPHAIARLGVGLVPEGRQVFPTLTVRENLVATSRPGAWDVAGIEALFPRLAERAGQMAATLSGGEQQMLAIGRALMSRPRFLMLDEPSLGIAPLLVKEIFGRLVELNRDRKLPILLVEQNANLALEVSHFGYVLETGRVILSGPAQELRSNSEVRNAYLGG